MDKEWVAARERTVANGSIVEEIISDRRFLQHFLHCNKELRKRRVGLRLDYYGK